MSLQAWYPLNGNINNYGVGRLQPIVSTTPSYVKGKLCDNAMSVGGFYWSAEQAASILNNKAISFAFWIYPINTTSGQIFGTSGMTPPNNRKFAIFAYPSGNDLHLSWQNEDSGTFVGGAWNGVFPSNKWTHCCITYNNPNGVIYINGNQYTTFSGASSSSSFAYSTQVIHSSANRYLQDFRVYDHCLSPREVKEIAQGLVFHYPLNNGNNTNMLSNSYKLNGKANATDATFGFPYCSGDNVSGTSYKDIISWGGFTVSPNEVYTVSFYARSSTSKQLITYFYNNTSGVVQVTNIKSSAGDNKAGTDGNCTLNLTPQWKKFWVTWTFNSSGTAAAKTLLFRLPAGSKADVALVKLERGNIATPYGLAPNEIGDTLIEKDHSGFNNHAKRSAILDYVSTRDSRYSNATKFGGKYIRNESTFSTQGWTDFTMSAWVNPTTYHSERSCVIIGGMYLTISSGGKVSTYCYGKSPEGYHYGATTIPLNTWTHIAAVWNGAQGYHKIYVNGVEDFSIACTGSVATNFATQKEIGAETSGASRIFSGAIADARIYATALSATDIKTLYESAMALVGNGQFRAYEFNEEPDVSNLKMSKTGSVKAADISEIGYLGGMKVKTLPDGSAWARIHWLDVTNTKSWFTQDEVDYCDLPNRFSRMGVVDHFKQNNNTYEFMLTYPRLSTNYNRWSQTSSPNSDTVTGLNKIVTASGWSHYGGIRKNGSACVYNCDTGSTWYAPIGQKQTWTDTQYIPAADGSSQTETELWVRIDNLPNLDKISMLNNEHLQAFNIYEF